LVKFVINKFALLILLAGVAFGQSPADILGGGVFGNRTAGGGSPSTYTYSTYTYVAETGGTNVASITSPSISLSAGDFAWGECRAGTSSLTSDLLSDSCSDSFSHLTLSSSAAVGASQGNYSLSSVGGSCSFTCTPSASSPYQAMAVMVFHHSGAAAVYNAGTDVNGSAGCGAGTCTSGSFSTGAPALVIFCLTMNTNGSTFTAGLIGGTSSTLGGVSGSSLTGTADAGCEYEWFSSTQSGITSGMSHSSGSAVLWNGAAFN
jgi:hypothetical protein